MFKCFTKFKFSELNIFYIQWFNIKYWIRFYYIIWFGCDAKLFIHVIKRIILLFSIFFVIFNSVPSFSCCFQREDRNIWLFAFWCFVQIKVPKNLWRNKRKSEKIREMKESSKILFEETEHFDLLFKRTCRYWPSAFIEKDFHVPPQCRPCSFNYLRKIFHENDFPQERFHYVRLRMLMLPYFIRCGWTDYS